MRSQIMLIGLASLAIAAPRPQDIDFEVVDAAGEAPPVTLDPLAAPTIVRYHPSSAAEALKAALATDISDPAPLADKQLTERSLKPRNACDALNDVGGPKVRDPDTPAAFRDYLPFSEAAKAAADSAAIPTGYTLSYSDKKAASRAYGWLGFVEMSAYNVNACASKCDTTSGCAAFNIYFERQPSKEPGEACRDQESTTSIKCVLWGGPVTADNADYTGGEAGGFESAVAGSNGYVAKSIVQPQGYSSATYLGNAAINAPLDCNGDDTFMGSKMFNNGPFDAGLCAAACTAQTLYNLKTATTNKPAKTCQFFTTYLLLKNGISTGQYCSLYTQSWNSSFATNKGQYRGTDKYTIAWSYSFSNATNPGKPKIDCDVKKAATIIDSQALQPFCSSLLGYTTPVQTIVSTATTVVTLYTTTSLAVPAKRALVTPPALADIPASALSSACSMKATPVTTTAIEYAYTTATSTTLVTVTQTPKPQLEAGCYKIVSVFSGKNIDEAIGNWAPVQYEDNGVQWQVWYIDGPVYATSSTKPVHIISTYSRRYLTSSPNQRVSTGVSENPPTRWNIKYANQAESLDQFLVENNLWQGYSLDVQGGVDRGNNVPIILYQTHRGVNQRWRFQRVACPAGF